MVKIHSPTAEIRRGKRRKKKQDENIMVCPITATIKRSFKSAGQIVTYWHLGAVIALVFRHSHNLAVRLQKNLSKMSAPVNMCWFSG